jgi:hypothetical protein
MKWPLFVVSTNVPFPPRRASRPKCSMRWLDLVGGKAERFRPLLLPHIARVERAITHAVLHA